MNCRQAQNCIQLDMDAELSANLREPFERHLDQCEKCRRMQAQMRVMSGALIELGAPTREASPLRFTPDSHPIYRWRIPLAAAAAITLLLSGWGLMHRIDRGHTPENSFAMKPSVAKTPQPTEVNAPLTQLAKAATTPQPPVVRVTFSDESDVVALPVQTRNPNVTILRIYPKLQVARLPESTGQQGS